MNTCYGDFSDIWLDLWPWQLKLRATRKVCSPLGNSSFLPRGLAMRILSVRLSVRLSVTRVHCDKTEERSVQIFIPYERTFILVFWEEEWLGGATPSTLNFGSTDPRWSEIADFEPIIARSASAVIPSKKVQLTLIGSPPRAFQWA